MLCVFERSHFIGMKYKLYHKAHRNKPLKHQRAVNTNTKNKYRYKKLHFIFGCVNGDWLCQWEMALFDPLQNRQPSTYHHKI